MTEPESKEPIPTEEKKEESANKKQSFSEFVQENKWETISYIILFCGLIFSLFFPFWGGLLVGFILGMYFSHTILDSSASFKEFIGNEGVFRGFIILAAALALLFEAPGLFIGTAIGVWVRPLLGSTISSPFDK